MGREVTSLTGYRAHVDALIQARQWETLLKDDQLTQMLSESGSVLRPSVTAESPEVCHWQEPNPDPSKSGPAFAPSFKLKVPGPGYSEKRMPAWTDRIIFRSHDVRPLRYQAVKQDQILEPPRNIADHNPVYAMVEVDCVRFNHLAFHSIVKDVLRHHHGHEVSGRLQTLMDEQARHFRWRFVNTSRPHIDHLAQRLFADLEKSNLDHHQMSVAVDRVIDTQQDCWRIICELLEQGLVDTACVDGAPMDALRTEERLLELSRDLSKALREHSSILPSPQNKADQLSFSTFDEEDEALNSDLQRPPAPLPMGDTRAAPCFSGVTRFCAGLPFLKS